MKIDKSKDYKKYINDYLSYSFEHYENYIDKNLEDLSNYLFKKKIN